MVAFDAVSKDWFDKRQKSEPLCNFPDLGEVERAAKRLWDQPPVSQKLSPFEHMPLYRIEFEYRLGEKFGTSPLNESDPSLHLPSV